MLRRSCQSSAGQHPIANAQHNPRRNIFDPFAGRSLGVGLQADMHGAACVLRTSPTIQWLPERWPLERYSRHTASAFSPRRRASSEAEPVMIPSAHAAAVRSVTPMSEWRSSSEARMDGPLRAGRDEQPSFQEMISEISPSAFSRGTIASVKPISSMR